MNSKVGNRSSRAPNLLESRALQDARIEDLEKQLEFYDQELNRMRQEKLSQPIDYTDKMVTNHEFQTMKLKMEKSELELSHRAAELQTSQTRLLTAEEQISDLRKHLQVVKEANSAKEQQLSLLQSDVRYSIFRVIVSTYYVTQFRLKPYAQSWRRKMNRLSRSSRRWFNLKLKSVG